MMTAILAEYAGLQFLNISLMRRQPISDALDARAAVLVVQAFSDRGYLSA
jgi:hypothetical protein